MKTAAILFGTAAVILAAPMLFLKPGIKAQAAVAPLTGEQLCRRDLKQHIHFNDPDSVRINGMLPGGGGGRPWFKMSVSAKNGYGGYGAPLTCSCVPEPAENRVDYLYCAQP